MSTHRIRTRPPRGGSAALDRTRTRDDPDVSTYLEDAAHYPGGHAAGVVCPRDEVELASVLRRAATVLPVGAQSSLTGGATPMGEVVVSTSKLTALGPPGPSSITAQPGVPLIRLRETLSAVGKAYPPTPTYEGATVGGIVSTNAAGAATFRYGVTRDWVRGLTVMLACGELLDLERGQVTAADGRFDIETPGGTIEIPVPTYRMPEVPKCSAGYHAAPNMDLIDLFVGSEGTLGVVTSTTLAILPHRPEPCLVLVALDRESQAIAVAGRLREASLRTRRDRDPRGLDVVAIEYLDHRCLELLRADGADRHTRVSVPDAVEAVMLAQVELAPGTTPAEVYAQVGDAASPAAPDGPMARLCHLLATEGLLDATELVAPGDVTRTAELFELREAVPEAVNRRVGIAKRTVDGTIEKTATDMIVPFASVAESLALFRTAFESRGLDYAIWGHLSDANLHANLIPSTADDVRLGKEAVLECGREVIRLGGSPLAEHGVGRNPVKQALLRLLHGDTGIAQMRAVKRALDPGCTLAPGVVFPVEPDTEGRA